MLIKINLILFMFLFAAALNYTSANINADSVKPDIFEKKAKKMTDDINKTVILTDSQYVQVYDIVLKYQKDKVEKRAGVPNKDERKKIKKELKAERDASINAVLNDEQKLLFEKWLQMKKDEDDDDE